MTTDEADTPINTTVYLAGFDYEYKGWVIYKNEGWPRGLVYHDGPWETNVEAQLVLDQLNKAQGIIL